MYIIRKINRKIECMNDSLWEDADVANICCRNWRQFEYFPHTTAKLLYSDYGIHVQAESEEYPILASYRHQNTSVCIDSCMEFFFSPNLGDNRYFNFEINPFGTMYLGWGISADECINPKEDKEYFEIKTMTTEKSWKIQYTIPFEFINKYAGGCSDVMRGNFYKCGNSKVHKHYLSFYPLHATDINFHRPQYFGEIVFEK